MKILVRTDTNPLRFKSVTLPSKHEPRTIPQGSDCGGRTAENHKHLSKQLRFVTVTPKYRSQCYCHTDFLDEITQDNRTVQKKTWFHSIYNEIG